MSAVKQVQKIGQLRGSSGALVPVMPNLHGVQSLSGAGAVNITQYLTNCTSTGASQALTLAAGSSPGQLKKVAHVVDGGSLVLTPTSATGFSTVTFTSVGEYAVLMWTGGGWIVVELGNTATPGTLPALA